MAAKGSTLRASVSVRKIRCTPTHCPNIELIKEKISLRGGFGHSKTASLYKPVKTNMK